MYVIEMFCVLLLKAQKQANPCIVYSNSQTCTKTSRSRRFCMIVQKGGEWGNMIPQRGFSENLTYFGPCDLKQEGDVLV